MTVRRPDLLGPASQADLKVRPTKLPLHSAGFVAIRQRVHFLHRHAIEVSRKRLLERTCGDGETERGFGRAAGDETIDQSRGEAVAATDAIDEPDVVVLAVMKDA